MKKRKKTRVTEAWEIWDVVLRLLLGFIITRWVFSFILVFFKYKNLHDLLFRQWKN